MSWRVRLDTVAQATRGLSLMAWERARTGVVFNPLRKDLRVDPHPYYRMLREVDFFHRTWAGDGWVISRYRDVAEVLGDRTLSSDERNQRRWPRERARHARAGLPDPYEIDISSMLRRDPPDHTRLRGLVSKAFTPRAIERMRPRIETLTDELIGALPRHGEIELVGDFAAPLPVSVIAEMLGVPVADRDRFRHWSDEVVKLLGDSTIDEVRQGLRAFEELGRYIEGVARARRSEPRDDLISGLVAAEDAGGDRLSARELVSTSILLLIAGNETTTKLIANALIALIRNPEQLAILRAEPKRIEGAIDELLRYDGPVQLTSRMPTEDREVCGHAVRKGQQLILMLAGANRDPEQFEHPDRLDVTREDVRHLAFSRGLHFCLGAQLAKLEAAVALEALITRWPDVGFGSAPIEWGTNTVLRGPLALPLRV